MVKKINTKIVSRFDPAIESTGYEDPSEVAVMEKYKKGRYVTWVEYKKLLKENQRLSDLLMGYMLGS